MNVGESRCGVLRPPGKVAGLELDLNDRQIGQPLWNWGRSECAAQTQRGGHDVFARVDCTEFVAGQGVREHILFGQAADPIRNLPAPRVMWWLFAMQGEVAINFFRVGSVDIGTVYAGEREIKFNPAAGIGSISYDMRDPFRSPFMRPFRFRRETGKTRVRPVVFILQAGSRCRVQKALPSRQDQEDALPDSADTIECQFADLSSGQGSSVQRPPRQTKRCGRRPDGLNLDAAACDISQHGMGSTVRSQPNRDGAIRATDVIAAHY
jgi:hypothetical protein